MNSWQCAFFAASITSSSVAFRRPYRMFSMSVRWKRIGSCGTNDIAARKLSCVTSAMLCPSMAMTPSLTSNMRRRSFVIVDFPAPEEPTSVRRGGHAVRLAEDVRHLARIRERVEEAPQFAVDAQQPIEGGEKIRLDEHEIADLEEAAAPENGRAPQKADLDRDHE